MRTCKAEMGWDTSVLKEERRQMTNRFLAKMGNLMELKSVWPFNMTPLVLVDSSSVSGS
jgi:hypothetical protein